MRSDIAGDVSKRITSGSFRDWRRQQQIAENVREGKAWFNKPPTVTPPDQHSPSQLLQCHRKIYYRQRNAPSERPDPDGVFWFGTKFEEEVLMPYLEDVAEGVAYVQNSMWVDFTVKTDQNEVRFRGSTDPVVVDREGTPILPTEIKTKNSVENLDEPNSHHLAQVHAYMYGLSQKWETDIDEALIIYGSRSSLEIRVFTVEFDEEFWESEVLSWAGCHTKARAESRLPPPEPAFGWECGFCSYRRRCGVGEEARFRDVDAVGLLPLFAGYPRENVQEYLRSHSGAKLTPSLATQYPDLAEVFEAYEWECPVCSGEFSACEVDWDGNVAEPPLCPDCKSRGVPSSLRDPSPERQASMLLDSEVAYD